MHDYAQPLSPTPFSVLRRKTADRRGHRDVVAVDIGR